MYYDIRIVFHGFKQVQFKHVTLEDINEIINKYRINGSLIHSFHVNKEVI